MKILTELMRKSAASAPQKARPKAGAGATYESGQYWASRTDMLYYQNIDYIVRCIASRASSVVDVGTGNCPYLEWFYWIPRKVSIDIRKPYASDTVEGWQMDILAEEVTERFDLCTCLQVLEHVPDPAAFARRLTGLADLVLVSVPYKWPKNQTKGHIHDPVDEAKLAGWFGREPNWKLIVREPFGGDKARRLIAIYHSDPARRFGSGTRHGRKPKQPPDAG